MGSSARPRRGWCGGSAAYSQALLVWCGPDEGGKDCQTKYRGARQRVRKVDRSSVVVGEDLSTRDGKVKVSAKKNTCSSTDQKACGKSCEGTEMANGYATTLLFSNINLYKIYDHLIDK